MTPSLEVVASPEVDAGTRQALLELWVRAFDVPDLTVDVICEDRAGEAW